MSWVDSRWYSKKSPFYWKLLVPAEGIYRGVIRLRRACYRRNIFKSHRLPVPVIVVGNITVGGVGKTPLTAALLEFLKKNNFRPGIISRGYKGKAASWPQIVDENSNPILLGDEPVLLAQKTASPVVVGPNRVLAAKKLLEKFNVNLIISDDGLQHYALERDIEIAVIDGERQFGNGHCLPFGPLREPQKRLETADFIVINGETKFSSEYKMKYQIADLFCLQNPQERKSLSEFKNTTVHAFAGIGNPKRFFQTLQENGLTIIEHPLPDHHHYQPEDFDKIPSDEIIIMTEKDAIKCRFLKNPKAWVLPIQAELSQEFFLDLLKKLKGLNYRSSY